MCRGGFGENPPDLTSCLDDDSARHGRKSPEASIRAGQRAGALRASLRALQQRGHASSSALHPVQGEKSIPDWYLTADSKVALRSKRSLGVQEMSDLKKYSPPPRSADLYMAASKHFQQAKLILENVTSPDAEVRPHPEL